MAKLLVVKKINAPRDEVFRAWVDRDLVEKWYGPNGFTINLREFNPLVGGAYDMTMMGPDSMTHNLKGEFREMHPPVRLSFTWQWYGEEVPSAETIVTVEFRESDGGTEITLTHDNLPDQTAVHNHQLGWTSSFEKLQSIF